VRSTTARPLTGLAVAGLLVASACRPDADLNARGTGRAARGPASDTVDASVVPPDTAMPTDSLGASMRRGRALLAHTADSLPGYAGSNLRCLSCHLDGGRRSGVAPLLGAYTRYPHYVDRTGAVVSIEERINYCFTRSLAGRALPSSSREMQDMVSYLAFLSTGVPGGAHVRGEGMPRLPMLTGDRTRGAGMYGPMCARCHGQSGEGTSAAPALWGPRSFSIGASMAREERAASFIRHAMPYDRPGTLSDQDAFDLAAFMMAHARPDLAAKARDWPGGDAPSDVPYATRGHPAYRPPSVIPRRGDTAGTTVPAPTPAPAVPADRRPARGGGSQSDLPAAGGTRRP
jgi:thiosulfate dehydrogenase